MHTRERITKLYNELNRSYFMPRHKDQAKLDMPFPIGHGQTISQPSLVLEMTILLDISPKSKILEIGTGSGFQTALLAKAGGKVYTVERIEALHTSAQKRLDAAGYTTIEYLLSDGSLGWSDRAPYDRIMVTAAAATMPEALINQLKPEGKMVIPVGKGFTQELLLVNKDEHGTVETEHISFVRFVELVEGDDIQ